MLDRIAEEEKFVGNTRCGKHNRLKIVGGG